MGVSHPPEKREMLLMMSKLSIITPVHNCIEYIGDAIESVAKQNCENLEHIIVDGLSTDGTVSAIELKAKKYSHIRWISECDKGQSDAMNKGVALATGGILGFLNADDYYEPNIFKEVQEKFSGLPEPTLLVGNCTVWKADGLVDFVSRPNRISLKNLLLGMYLEAFPMNSSAYFYHKSLHDRIGLYVVDDHYSMDLQFIYRALMSANVTYMDKTFGNFRYFEGTKTYEDYQRGDNCERVRSVTKKYFDMMSPPYQLYLRALSLRRKFFGV